MDRLLPHYRSGQYYCCDPSCRAPFVGFFGAADALILCPVLPAYGAYCCADCMKKGQFKKKFLEGQSCLPEHRVSIKNFFSLFNSCCGPSD